jgi:flagellar biosynthesis/type III secretory pathway protein FliH
MTEGGTLQVTEDEGVERGGCVLETGFGTIKATVSDQLSIIDKVIDRAFAAGDGGEP